MKGMLMQNASHIVACPFRNAVVSIKPAWVIGRPNRRDPEAGRNGLSRPSSPALLQGPALCPADRPRITATRAAGIPNPQPGRNLPK